MTREEAKEEIHKDTPDCIIDKIYDNFEKEKEELINKYVKLSEKYVEVCDKYSDLTLEKGKNENK